MTRAASLVIFSLGFIQDLRAGLLQPVTICGTRGCLEPPGYLRMFVLNPSICCFLSVEVLLFSPFPWPQDLFELPTIRAFLIQ